MDAIRRIYESIPDTITIPPEWRRRRVEVIILPLDDGEIGQGKPDDEIKKFFGSLPDFPERGPQGEYEEREDLS
jgi:hypothetical protein